MLFERALVGSWELWLTTRLLVSVASLIYKSPKVRVEAQLFSIC